MEYFKYLLEERDVDICETQRNVNVDDAWIEDDCISEEKLQEAITNIELGINI